jgi:hypothetical protein
LQLRLTEAEIHYRDDLLETAATASDLTVQVDGSPTEVAVDIAATVSSPGAETTGQLNAQATVAGLGKSVPLPELLVDGKAQLQSLPLLPYRGLLDKWFAVVPPLRSLSATIVVSTADRKLRIDSDLDVGAVAAESLQVSLPLDMDTDELAELRGDVTLRLPENFHAPGLELPEGLELRGETEVRLQEIVARVNLRDIAAVPDNLEAHAKLTLQGNVLYQGFDTRSVQAELHCRHGKASIEKLVATVNEGRVSSNALMVNLKETPPAYRGDVKLEDIRGTYEMTPLLAYAVPFLSLDKEQADFHGRLHGNLEVSGRGFSQKDMARSLQGAGNVRVRDGSFTASKFFQGVVSLFGAKMDRLRFSELGSDFTLGSAKLVASKVFLRPREDGKMRNLGLVGVTGFDGSLDFSVNLAAIHASVGDKKIRGILEEAQKIFKSDTLPLRLGGTLDSPQLQFGAATGKQGQEATPSAFEKLLETAGAATKELAGEGSEAKETPEAEAGSEERTSGKQETKKEKTFGVESIFQILEDRKREKKERRRQRREKKKKQQEEGQATS